MWFFDRLMSTTQPETTTQVADTENKHILLVHSILS